MLRKLDSSLFTWHLWRAGSPLSLNIKCRENIIISNKSILIKHGIGYCNGENLLCRPKVDTKAVMFFDDEGNEFWFHLTNKEFKMVFEL